MTSQVAWQRPAIHHFRDYHCTEMEVEVFGYSSPRRSKRAWDITESTRCRSCVTDMCAVPRSNPRSALLFCGWHVGVATFEGRPWFGGCSVSCTIGSRCLGTGRKKIRDLVGETKACRLGAIQLINSPKPFGNDEKDILVVKQSSNSSLAHSRHMILRNIRFVSKQVVESNPIWYLAREDDPI